MSRPATMSHTGQQPPDDLPQGPLDPAQLWPRKKRPRKMRMSGPTMERCFLRGGEAGAGLEDPCGGRLPAPSRPPGLASSAARAVRGNAGVPPPSGRPRPRRGMAVNEVLSSAGRSNALRRRAGGAIPPSAAVTGFHRPAGLTSRAALRRSVAADAGPSLASLRRRGCSSPGRRGDLGRRTAARISPRPVAWPPGLGSGSCGGLLRMTVGSGCSPSPTADVRKGVVRGGR